MPVTEWNDKQLLAEVSGRLLRGMDRAASFTAEEARRRAPVGATGRLRREIDYEVRPDRNDVVGYVGVKAGGLAANQGPAFYGYFLELGTSKMAARPFLRPAVFENADQIIRFLTEG